MALIKSVRGFTPKIGKDTFLAITQRLSVMLKSVKVAVSGLELLYAAMSIPSVLVMV